MLLLVAIAQAAISIPTGKIVIIPRPCDAQTPSNDDVVVCGRRDSSSRYRLPPLSPLYETDRRKAELKLGDGTNLSAETERVDIGGTPSNRAMIRLKFKF